MRGFLHISQNKASKTSVSCEASSKFHRTSFQNDRFVRCFFEISQNKLPKRSFRARLPAIFTEKASKTIVSCDASSKFQRTSFQNERFVRGFFKFSQNKLQKRTFRAKLPANFTEQAPKTNVSCEASSKFQRTSFQNERFVRGFFKFSQNKLQKRTFRARLPANFTEQASKTSVSCEASSKFQRTSFQNERFVRGFLEISQNKLPKRSFRARLLRNFTEQAYKTSVSRETYSNFERTKLPKRTFRAKLPTISIENLRFTTAACAKIYKSSARRSGGPAAYKNQHFTTVSDI